MPLPGQCIHYPQPKTFKKEVTHPTELPTAVARQDKSPFEKVDISSNSFLLSKRLCRFRGSRYGLRLALLLARVPLDPQKFDCGRRVILSERSESNREAAPSKVKVGSRRPSLRMTRSRRWMTYIKTHFFLFQDFGRGVRVLFAGGKQ